MKNNKLMNLYHAVGDFEKYLEILRDYPDTEGGDDRSDLEKEMTPHLEALFNMCRKHPQFFELTHKTAPHIFDEDGDFIPFDTEAEREKRISSYRIAIEQFCKDFEISKTRFSKAYGCGNTYLSRILSGEKAANHDNFIGAFWNLGYMASPDNEWNWTFEKINQFL